ncbi:CocE/NonD family hydrolase [Mesorhizobium erdmanii]|uniref:CocE/NonD family hydrolase n=1 Tax=Mesorhizobium erdmanii TaxID=1777866 RepID=UPI000517DA5E
MYSESILSPYSSNLRKVREIELCWIPVSEGTRLAARIFMPEDAESNPVPAILEYIPYRRRDATRARDDLTHPYFAAHGYASIRLDIRGTGDSDGVILDEYLKQEQDDAVEAIAWIAKQPWCNGAIGMMGISWGGFNSLQVAARRPPALKAIITACSTDDRYTDDMHYMGGCVITDILAWGTSYFGMMSRSPDPLMVGEDRWRDMWMERLNVMTPVFSTWLEHQRRDHYWRHGSVCEDFSSIQAAVFAVGGWADGYSNAIFRLLSGLKGPRLGLVGPWGHKYPHIGVPGPAIGFLQEALRWWDYWLKGIETGIMDEPMLRAYVQDTVPPASHYEVRPGRWIGEPSWPSGNIQSKTFWLAPHVLCETPNDQAMQMVKSPENTGMHGGEWCAYGIGGLSPELPLDQREEDGKSLVFDTAPLAEHLEILGAPIAVLTISADQPNGLVAVRLNDIAPDGTSIRVTYGLLNLTHRESHETPKSLEPGARYQIRVQLNEIGHKFPPGHRIRLAISTAYWPIAWPSPQSVTLTVFTGDDSGLMLPTRNGRPDDADIRFAEPVTAAQTKNTLVRQGKVERTVGHDIVTGETIHTVIRDDGNFIIDAIGVETAFKKATRYRIRPNDPTSARMEVCETYYHGHPGWRTRVEVETALSSTTDCFIVEADLRAYEDDRRIFSRSWSQRIARDLV